MLSIQRTKNDDAFVSSTIIFVYFLRIIIVYPVKNPFPERSPLKSSSKIFKLNLKVR